MDGVWLPPGNFRSMGVFRGQEGIVTWVIEVTEFNSEVRCDLRGHLEVAMASEGTKMAVGSNMGMDIRVIEVADVKFEVM